MNHLLVVTSVLFLASCTHSQGLGRIGTPADYVSAYKGKAINKTAAIVLDNVELPPSLQLFTGPWHTMVHTDVQTSIKDALARRLRKVFSSVKVLSKEKAKTDKSADVFFYPHLKFDYHYHVYSRSCDVTYGLLAKSATGEGISDLSKEVVADSGMNYELETLCKRGLEQIFDHVNDLVLNAVALTLDQ